MRAPTPHSRTPWWLYLVAAIYLLTFFFNLRQEFMGPAASGWSPVASTLKVASVAHGSALEKAGLRARDVLESIDGHPLNGAPDWFLARANLEIGRPVQLQVSRDNAHLQLQFVITTAFWQQTTHWFASAVVYLCRFIPLLVAIVIVFRRPSQVSVRLVAFMLAAAAVAEGYPSPGWMATVRHLPIVIAAPICLATASWLLAPVAWLSFFAIFPQPWLSRKWRLGFAFTPLVIFLPPLLASVIALLRDAWTLSAAWPQVLSHAPVRWLVGMAGVNTLFFFNHWPLSESGKSGLLELWFAMTVTYLVAGFLMLVASYSRLQQRDERRRVGALLASLIVLAVIVVQNFFVRNWAGWFGTTPPALFSGATYVVEALLSLVAPFTLAYAVLKSTEQSGISTQSANTSG